MALQSKKTGALQDRQEAFCQHYSANKGNAKQAAISAGYSPKTSQVQGSRLLSIAKVRSRIDAINAKSISALGYTREDILKELALMGFARPEDYLVASGDTMAIKDVATLGDKSAAIKTLKAIPCGDGATRLEIGFHDKKAALELLGKNMNLFTDKVDITSGGEKLPAPTLYLPDNGKRSRRRD